MKQVLRPKYLPLLVMLFGILGFLLRLQTFGNGPDADGLYAPQPLMWCLLIAVTAAALAVILFTCSRLKANGKFSDNFPPSILSAAGCCLGLVGLFSSALPLLGSENLLSSLTGILGLAATAAMGAIAFSRYRGTPPFFLCHPAISIYLGLRIFLLGKQWGNESQIGLFILPLAALVFTMLAAYHLATFDVDLGVRKSSVFWSMSGAYFCIVSLADRTDALLYAGLAAWLLTNLCTLRPLRAPKAEPEELPETESPEEPIRPMTMDEIDQQMNLK